jgi:hypothetical protein
MMGAPPRQGIWSAKPRRPAKAEARRASPHRPLRVPRASVEGASSASRLRDPNPPAVALAPGNDPGSARGFDRGGPVFSCGCQDVPRRATPRASTGCEALFLAGDAAGCGWSIPDRGLLDKRPQTPERGECDGRGQVADGSAARARPAVGGRPDIARVRRVPPPRPPPVTTKIPHCVCPGFGHRRSSAESGSDHQDVLILQPKQGVT